MPHNQDQAVTRRQSRRKDSAETAEQLNANGAVSPRADATDASAPTTVPSPSTAAITPTAATKRPRTARAASASPSMEAATSGTQAPKRQARGGRKSASVSAETAADAATVSNAPTAATQAQAAMESAAPKTAPRRRAGRPRSEAAASDRPAPPAAALPEVASATTTSVTAGDTAAATVPTRRRSARAAKANGTPSTAPAEQPPVPATVSVEVSPITGQAAERHSPYRFARPARPEEPGGASGAETTFASPSAPAPAAREEPPAGASGNEPAGLGIAPRRTASDVTIRPLRRPDRSAWTPQEPRAGRERGAPNPPTPAEPYRGRGPEQGQGQGQGQGGSRGPGGRPQRGVPGQPPPGRGTAPYTPGGRPSQQGSEPPYTPGNGGAPYGPYTPYEPYTGYPPAGPSEPRQGGQQRPLRGGRGYSNAPGYQDQRGQRGPANRPGQGAPDLYRESGNYGPQNGRGPGRGYTDRRGSPPNRGGNVGGRPRERDTNYGLYTPAPGMPPAENRYAPGSRGPSVPAVVRTIDVSGVLWLGGGAGMSPAEVLDESTLQPVARMNPEDARRMSLRSGDVVSGRAEERGARRTLVALDRINDRRPEEMTGRPQFEQLTASFPDRRIRLEQGPLPVSSRIIDLFAPLGFGSRALIVAPPKTGKTTLIREAAESVLKGYPDAVVMAVLVGERPEEVTDLRARLEPRGGLVYAASFDEDTQRHAWLVQVAVERAKRVAESGRDAFMVLDSLTRLARAENLATRGQGRTLSGGIDAQALDTGRRAFGAARNLEEGGSLTILATCLVDTGSRQDDVVYEEFKGTGNMELHLSRELAQRRLFPAVDAVKSGTRREEMLLTPEELRAATALRRRLADLPAQQATQQLLSVMERTPSNSALLSAIEQSGWTGTAR